MAATKSCSGKAILAIRHYKNNACFVVENACDALTMENVAYSDFMEIMKNENVLRTLTRSIFAHTQNSSGITIHSLVKVSGIFMCKYAWEHHETMNSALYGVSLNGQARQKH